MITQIYKSKLVLLSMDSRGQRSFGAAIALVVMLVGMLAILGLGSGFQENFALNACSNATLSTCEPSGQNIAYNATKNSLDAFQNASLLLPTIGFIMLAMILLAAVGLMGR